MLSRQFYNRILYSSLTIGSIALILMSSLIFLNNNESFNLEKLLIIGSRLTNEESINSQFSYLKNQSIIFIDKQEIRNKLLENQLISDVKISLLLPDILIFNIKEITPIGLLKINNKDFLIGNNNKGFYCSSIISNSIVLPRIQTNKSDNENMIFNHASYNLIKKIRRNNLQIFNSIDSVISNDYKININFKNNGYVEFDLVDCMEQLKYLTSFFSLTNKTNTQKFEYIKFVDSNIIIKEIM